MESIKVQRTTNNIKLGKILYKPYTVGNLPPSFAFKWDDDNETEGIDRWFNYKGLTYIRK